MGLFRKALRLYNQFTRPFHDVHVKIVDDLIYRPGLVLTNHVQFFHHKLRATYPLHDHYTRRAASYTTMSRRTSRQALKAAIVESDDSDVGTNGNAKSTAASKTKVAKRKATKAVLEEEHEAAAVVEDEAKPTKKRKTTKNKVEDTTPLAERTDISSLKKSMYIGAHVSSAGGRLRKFESFKLLD